MKTSITILKYYYSLIGKLNNDLAGKKLFKLAQRTRKLKFKPAEKAFYQKAHPFTAPSKIGDILCYETGDIAGPLAVLVHGWDSNAGSMSGVGEQLAEQGYHVIAFDFPAHGKHRGTHTNLLQCQIALEAVIERIRPSSPFSIVAHSFGTAVTCMTLIKQKYAIDQLVFLSTTNELVKFFEPLKKMLKIKEKTYQNVLHRVEGLLKLNLEEIRMDVFLRDIPASNITVIHDKYDRILPYSNALSVVQNNGHVDLVTIHKAGHYRMLWNEAVLDIIGKTFFPASVSAPDNPHSNAQNPMTENSTALAI